MARRSVERCRASVVGRDMRIETTVRCCSARARQGGWREKGRGRQQALARPRSIGGGTQESALQAKAPASAKAREGRRA